MACKDLMTWTRTLEITSTGRKTTITTYECKALWWAELTLDGEGEDDYRQEDDDDDYIF